MANEAAPTPAPQAPATPAPAAPAVAPPPAPARVAAPPVTDAPRTEEALVPSFRLREEATKRDEAIAEANKLRIQLESREQEFALYREGIVDPEDMGEFRDRYNRVPAGEDGKKPAFAEWVKGVKEGRPKWALPYLPAPPSEDADPGAGATNNPAQRVAAAPPPVRQPPGNPNGGASTTTTTPRVMGDAEISRLKASGQLKGATLKTAIEQARAQGLVK